MNTEPYLSNEKIKELTSEYDFASTGGLVVRDVYEAELKRLREENAALRMPPNRDVETMAKEWYLLRYPMGTGMRERRDIDDLSAFAHHVQSQQNTKKAKPSKEDVQKFAHDFCHKFATTFSSHDSVAIVIELREAIEKLLKTDTDGK